MSPPEIDGAASTTEAAATVAGALTPRNAVILPRGTDNSPAARRGAATERLREDLAGARFWGFTADAAAAVRALDDLYVSGAYLRAQDRDIRRLRRLLRGAA